jgi:hypothetical protein
MFKIHYVTKSRRNTSIICSKERERQSTSTRRRSKKRFSSKTSNGHAHIKYSEKEKIEELN